MQNQSRVRHCLLLLTIVVWGGLLRGASVPGPFGLGWQHLGALYGNVARNFHEYGFLETRGAQIRNAAPAPREQWHYFTHHPPGMGWSTAVSFAIFGESAAAVKIPGAVFSTLQILVVYWLVAGAFSVTAALAAAFMIATLPAGAYFSTHGSDLGPQAITLGLCTLLADQWARKKNPDRPKLGLVVAVGLVGVLFDWLVLLILGGIVIRDFFGKNYRRAAIVGGLLALVFPVYLGWLTWATGSLSGGEGKNLWDSFIGHGVVGTKNYLSKFPPEVIQRKLTHYVQALFTPGGLVLAATGLVFGLTSFILRERRHAVPGLLILFALLIFGAGFTVPFPRAVVIHQFWMMIWLPFLATLIGLAVQELGRWRWGLVVASLAVLGVGVMATWEVRDRQRAVATEYFAEAGAAIQKHCASNQPILTSEKASEALTFYARQDITGGIDDQKAAGFMLNAAPSELPTVGYFFVVEPPVDPPTTDSDELVTFLSRHFQETVIPLEATGSVLRLYDFSHSRSFTDPEPNGSD